jgi:thiamine-monophosphate kinase
MAFSEFDLIAAIQQRLPQADDEQLLLGMGDDGAIIQPAAGEQLVISTDTMNTGVHFLPDDNPADIGHKLVAVNLSDLAAMAASPRWCLLNLSLPTDWNAAQRSDWLHALLDGMLPIMRQHDLQLIGGDTTSGLLSLTMTVLGTLPAGTAVTRSGAEPGDHILLSGNVGDAAAALHLLRQDKTVHDHLLRRLRRPTPHNALGIALRGIASAMIDVSDGLLADLDHILQASAVGASIELDRVPQSAQLSRAALHDDEKLHCMLNGGDDYELCCCVPDNKLQAALLAAQSCAVELTTIGRIEAQPGLRCVSADGQQVKLPAAGWQHFHD